VVVLAGFMWRRLETSGGLLARATTDFRKTRLFFFSNLNNIKLAKKILLHGVLDIWWHPEYISTNIYDACWHPVHISADILCRISWFGAML
jgi:hypothetical protein